MPLTFGSFRNRLEDMSAVDQQALANAIKACTTREAVTKHHLGNGAHGFGHMHHRPLLPGSGRDFFKWHRDYLADDMERCLGRRLPSWRPWNPIPGAFKQPANERGNVHDPSPPVTELEFLPFCSALVGHWPNADALGTALSWGPHFRVHTSCGGDMSWPPDAPRAPIFWCWHAFVDEIYEDWLRQADKRRGLTPKIAWPWPTPPDHHTHAHAMPIPFLYGLKLSEATEVIQDHGFQIGETRSLNAPHERIFGQSPLPFTLRRGGSVKLSGKVEADWASPF